MKYIQSILLAVSLLAPALPTLAATAGSVSVYADDSQLIDAAGALAYRARLALTKVQTLDATSPSADLDKAARLARFINAGGLQIVTLIEDRASYDEVAAKLQEVEPYVLQLDATKRSLLSRYPSDSQLRSTLNDVRRTYFYLKQLLTGSI